MKVRQTISGELTQIYDDHESDCSSQSGIENPVGI